MKRPPHIHHTLLILVFLAWISVPLAYRLFRPAGAGISRAENRVLAPKPVLRAASLRAYPAAWEKYFNDHFFLRHELIHLNTLVVDYYLFKRSPIPSEVAFGQGGWIYATGSEREIYEGRNQPGTARLMEIAGELHRRALEYRAMGIIFYVAVAPMKCDVYPEFLPGNFIRSEKPAFPDELMTILARDTLCHLVNLKDSLVAAKKSGWLFYRTDSHWNGLGAWYSYRGIVNRIHRDFPAVKPLDMGEFRLSGYRHEAGNLATMAGLQQHITEVFVTPGVVNPRSQELPKFGYPPPPLFGYPAEYELVRGIPDHSLPRAVVIRDSFFASLIPLFSEHFSRSVYIFDAWKYGPNPEITGHEKPDIVLLEIYTPNLLNIRADHPKK